MGMKTKTILGQITTFPGRWDGQHNQEQIFAVRFIPQSPRQVEFSLQHSQVWD